MVQANELRIGNWVKIRKDVSEVEGWMFIQETRNMEPIPLTPEILIAAGFEKIIYDAHKRNKVIAERLPEIAAQEMCDFKKSITHDGWQICLEETDCWDVWYGKSENWGDRLILCSLNYVHQLQNLYFALTEQELTINLQTKK